MTMIDLPSKDSFSKLDWAYSGLAHPSGVALARKHRHTALSSGSKVILVGDESASGLGPFLGKLAIERKVTLRFEWERGQPFEHWMDADRVEKLLAHRPTVILMAFGSKHSADVAPKLAELVKLTRPVPVLWILPLKADEVLSAALTRSTIKQFDSGALDVHRSQTGGPSVRGYAGWAGAIWGWIR